MSLLYVIQGQTHEPQQWFDGDELPESMPADSGVRWSNSADVGALVPYFAQLSCIALQFPKFTDGRAYSQARLLRRMGYQGRLRATGDAVVVDQALEIRAASFEEAELRGDQSIEQWQHWLSEQSLQGMFRPGRSAFLRAEGRGGN